MAEPGLLPGHLLRVAMALLAMALGALLPPGSTSATPACSWGSPSPSWSWCSFWGTAPGVRRWFYLGPMAFQPSELAKVALVFYLASFVGRKGNDYPIVGAAVLAAGTAGLVLVEPDFATALFLLTLSGLLFVFAGVPWRRLLFVTLAGLLVIAPFSGYYLARFRYVSERFTGFLDFLQGEASPAHTAYQVIQAQRPSSWPAPGPGPGGDLPHLPEAHTDMVFASVVFATGWLGDGWCFSSTFSSSPEGWPWP